MSAESSLSLPPHVPASLYYDFDYVVAPVGLDEPHQELSRRLKAETPPIFYTPRNGGHWIVHKPALAVDMFRQPELFSSHPDHNATRNWRPLLLPIQADPPEHGEYRKVFGAFFAPGNMRRIEPDIRAQAVGLLDGIAPKGGCDFVADIGEIFPIGVFLGLVGAPASDRDQLLDYARMFTRSPDIEVRSKGIHGLARYISGLFDARRAAPGTDIISKLVHSDFSGRPLTPDEEQGLGSLLFLAGLDTVKSVMSFIMLYLARNPEQYQKLVADPALIPGAVEELLRVSGASLPERGVARDLVYEGVSMKAGERVVFLLPLMSFDDGLNANPHAVDFARDVSQHINFGAGDHRCAGSHLARIETRVLLEEWIKRFPTFGVDPAKQPRMSAGTVWTPEYVPLVWPAAQMRDAT